MLTYLHFDVKIVRAVNAASLYWPGEHETGNGTSLAGNLEYQDFRQMTWDEAHDLHGLEAQLIARIEAAEDSDAEYNLIQDELYEDINGGLWGLDIGIASTVAALAAIGAIPFSSCNGGAFGGFHAEEHPLLVFFARPHMIPLLLDLAAQCEIGLENSDGGSVLAYAADIRKMPLFAKRILDQHEPIEGNASRPAAKPK
jgi:hypothetical protein